MTGTTWTHQINDEGTFVRRPTTFRGRISEDGSTAFPAVTGRYHLYVSLACPWAHRVLITRALMGLDEVISVDVVHPLLGSEGWTFANDYPGSTSDRAEGFSLLREAYNQANPAYEGTITVPVLWDKQERTIVNNESAEIVRMFAHELRDLAAYPEIDLVPANLEEKIDTLNAWIHPEINNGVYRCGFARSQAAYDKAFNRLFAALDRAEAILADHRYLTGDRLTEADIRLFTTLIRFDAVYHGHFKCNLRRIVDYPGLHRFMLEVLELPRVAPTVDLAQIKYHYYASHRSINPTGIVPGGPASL